MERVGGFLRILAVTLLASSVAACSGDDGAPGPAGPAGPAGQSGQSGNDGADGTNGADAPTVGTIQGNVTVQNGTALSPVPGATVSVLPDVGVSVTSGADGAYTLSVPTGVYSVVFSGTNVTRTQVDNVSVVAGKAITVNKTVAYTPIKLALSATPVRDAGFGNEVTLTVNATGAPAESLTYKWEYVKGSYAGDYPAAPAITDATKATAKFTTAAFSDIAPIVKFLRLADRPGIVTVSTQQARYFSYTFKVTVTDGKYTQTGSVNVTTVPMAQGVAFRSAKALSTTASQVAYTVAKGMPMVLNDKAAATYDWSIVTKPAGSAAELTAATTRNPGFKPDVGGTYVIKNASTGNEIVATAATFVGLGDHNGDVGCLDCHSTTDVSNPLYLPQIAAWKSSAHGWHPGSSVPMTLIEFGLRGLEADPAHYGQNCISCHTAGYSLSASNGGFDDVMAEAAWKFPANAAGLDNWTPMPAKLKNLSGMQCEACHGPAGAHLLGFWSEADQPAGFYDSQTCATCHDALGHHDRFQLWSQSRHSNLETAISANRGHCTRCHTSQTFVEYVNKGGFDAPGVVAPAAVASAAAVEPISCQTCHDPHTAGLRIDGSKPTVLPAGFTVRGGGAGQLCMACHNTRNGLRNDSVAGAAGSPHHSAQADVLMGQNAYFVATGKAGKHAMVRETCVGCHMELEAADPTLFVKPYHTNHAFRASGEELCGSCHGHNVSPEGVKEWFEGAVADLNATLVKEFAAKISATSPLAYKPYDGTTEGAEVVTSVAPTSLAIESSHGSLVVFMTFPGVAQPVEARYSSLKIGGATFATNGILAKAAWNIMLVEFDGSKGIHNPEFTREVIFQTKAALLNFDLLTNAPKGAGQPL